MRTVIFLAVVFTICFTRADFLSDFHAADLTEIARERTAFDFTRELRWSAAEMMPVVYEDDERGEFAAEYLAGVLGEAFGVKPEVYRLAKGVTNAFTRSFFLPAPSGEDEFSVAVSPTGVIFGGRGDFAAFDFCERMLGCRHYWDGPGGRDVPRRDSIALPCGVYRDAPVFEYRYHLSHMNSPWCRVAKAGGPFDRMVDCHSTAPGFCYGSPESQQEYLRRVDAEIDGTARPDPRFRKIVDRRRRVISVSPWDERYRCPCRWCRTRYTFRTLDDIGLATPVVWEDFLPKLVEHVERNHPDYRISVLPYWNYVTAPKTGTRLGTNVQAVVCSMFGLARFKWEHARRLEEGLILDWERATGGRVVNWHYSCWPAEYTSAAFVYGRTIQSHYSRLRNHLRGSFICSSALDFPRGAISQYVWMRCLWNPEIDVGAVYDGLCERLFGLAAGTMRRLVSLQEEEWDAVTLRFTKAVEAEQRRLLGEALRLTAGTRFRAAVAYYARGLAGGKPSAGR